tara:strand:- start:3515 stop:4006 length:492 start_codon:yes stop_codon:yes gene_type:complete
MADLKAKRILGGTYTADDTLELQFTYTGDAHSCLHYIEIVSGVTVTHGGGASASTPLHYKAVEVDADSDGVIDYNSSTMQVYQAEKGTSVIKAVVDLILASEVTAFNTAFTAWQDAYVTETIAEDGEVTYTTDEGAPDAPTYPEATTYKSGEITLKWEDDTYV